MHHNSLATFRIFAAICAGETWEFAAALLRHGPAWESVPSLLLAVAAMIGAVRSYLDGAQLRRHAEAEHKLKLDCFRRPPGAERLN
jgi:hypothetical protein